MPAYVELLYADPLYATNGAATLYYVVYDAAEDAPTDAQIVSGMAWEHAVAAVNAAARETTGEQSFAEVTGLDPGSYRAAFVWYDDEDYSNVSVSGAVNVTGIPVLSGASFASRAPSVTLTY